MRLTGPCASSCVNWMRQVSARLLALEHGSRVRELSFRGGGLSRAWLVRASREGGEVHFCLTLPGGRPLLFGYRGRSSLVLPATEGVCHRIRDAALPQIVAAQYHPEKFSTAATSCWAHYAYLPPVNGRLYVSSFPWLRGDYYLESDDRWWSSTEASLNLTVRSRIWNLDGLYEGRPRFHHRHRRIHQ